MFDAVNEAYHVAFNQAHRWMELCWARREGVKRAYGADYFTFAIT